jgi:hypothetical protein
MSGEQSEAPFTLTGEVNVTAADVAEGLGQLSLFRRRWIYLLLAAVLVGLLAGPGRASWSALTPFLVFTILFQAYLFTGARIMARRTIAAMPDRTVHYRADDREITITTAGSAVTRSWSRFTQYREGSQAFLLWGGPYQVQVIPKRAFSAEGIAWLRATLARDVKAERKTTTNRVFRLIAVWLILVVAFLVLWQLLDKLGGAPHASI